MLMLGLYSGAPSSGGVLLLDCSPFAQSCEVSTGEHGFEQLNASMTRGLADAFRFYDQPGMLYLGLFAGGQIVWEGRLEDPTLFAGPEGSGLTAQALGYWRALSDVPVTVFFSMTDVSQFRPMLQTEVSTSRPDRFNLDTNNRIYIAPVKGATLGTTGGAKFGPLCYLTPDDTLRGINGVQFDFELVSPAANWRGFFRTRDASFTGIANVWTLASAGAGTLTGAIFATFTSAAIVDFSMDFNAADAAFAGETGSAYLKITNMRLVSITTNAVNTTLTANRNAGTNVTATVGSTTNMYVGQRLVMNSGGAASESVVVLSIGSSTQFNATFVNNYTSGQAVQGHIIYADQIVGYLAAGVVAVLNPSQLSTNTALIQSPGLDLQDEVYEDAVVGDVFTRLASLGDNQTTPRMWEVGVWENRALFFRPQNTASRAWFVDATDLQIARTLEDLANSVYAVYKEAAGRLLRTAVTSDATSVARYGVTRRAAISADTTSATQAGVQQAAALADRKDPKPRASIQFDAVYDAAGARYPLWLVRAGDTMTIRNLPPNISTAVDRIRTFRISHTSYDAIADTLQIEPEAAPQTLEVALAEQGNATTPLPIRTARELGP